MASMWLMLAIVDQWFCWFWWRVLRLSYLFAVAACFRHSDIILRLFWGSIPHESCRSNTRGVSNLQIDLHVLRVRWTQINQSINSPMNLSFNSSLLPFQVTPIWFFFWLYETWLLHVLNIMHFRYVIHQHLVFTDRLCDLPIYYSVSKHFFYYVCHLHHNVQNVYIERCHWWLYTVFIINKKLLQVQFSVRTVEQSAV